MTAPVQQDPSHDKSYRAVAVLAVVCAALAVLMFMIAFGSSAPTWVRAVCGLIGCVAALVAFLGAVVIGHDCYGMFQFPTEEVEIFCRSIR